MRGEGPSDVSPPGMSCVWVQEDARDRKMKQLAAAGFLEGTRLPTQLEAVAAVL